MNFDDINTTLESKFTNYSFLSDQYGITINKKGKNPSGLSIGWIMDQNTLTLRNKIVALKRFDEVEDFLIPIMTKYKIGHGGFIQGLNGNSFIGTINREYTVEKIQEELTIDNLIHSLTQIQNLVEGVLEFTEIHFNNLYPTFASLKDDYFSLEFKELGSLINQPFPLRNSVIKYKYQASDYEEYIADLIPYYLENKDKKKRKHGTALIEIDKKLKSGNLA